MEQKIETPSNLSNETIEQLWFGMNDFLAPVLFDLLNKKLDRNELSISDLKPTPILTNQLFEESAKGLIFHYIETYISYFAKVENEGKISKALAIKMEDYFAKHADRLFKEESKSTLTLETPILSSDEEVQTLSSEERKSILRECHTNYSLKIIHAIATEKSYGTTQIEFEHILKHCPSLKEDYESLLAFETIKNRKAKKIEIQAVMQDYVKQILIASQFNHSSLEHFTSLSVAFFGASQTKNLYQTINNTPQYPSSLELEGASEGLRDRFRAIDILIHTSAEAKNYYFVRNALALIQKAFTFEKENKTQTKNNPIPSASTTKAPSPIGNVFGSFFEMQSDLENTKEKYLRYKKECLEKNKNSNFLLFRDIVNGMTLTKGGISFIKDNLIKMGLKSVFHVKDLHGNNALHLAALCGNQQAFIFLVTEELLTEKYPLDEKNNLLHSILDSAILGANKEIIDLLINTYGKKATQKQLEFALMVCPSDSKVPSLLF